MRAYGIYRNIRDGAWQCLIDHGVVSLPVDVLSICRETGIHVIKNSMVDVLFEDEQARSYYDSKTWHIIYNDQASVETSRFMLAHELGHILLNHELKFVKYSHTREIVPKAISEQQADRFAVRLLCPTCVICGLELHTAEEIANICKVDISVAEERARRMKELYRRNKFLTSSLEKEVYENFKPFIDQQKAALAARTEKFVKTY